MMESSLNFPRRAKLSSLFLIASVSFIRSVVNRQVAAIPELQAILKTRFGFPTFRPYQEEVCKTVAGGKDVLLVMPTGAGKSLCFQVPGLARGGTTIVVSPLIALIEDQVEKLKQAGIAAERMHSGRKVSEQRSVSNDYLEGKLDFLFIAPERLSVPSFIEMLVSRKNSPELLVLS